MPETITVDIWSICVFGVGVLAIAAIVIGYAVVRRVIKRTEIRKAERRAERQRQHEERQKRLDDAIAQDRDQRAELFPQPWLQAYDECESMGRHSDVRVLWLKTWIQDGSGLPGKQLSMEGIKKFAEMVGKSDYGDDFREAWELLRPYYKSTSVTPVGTPMPRIAADLCKICKQRDGIVRERSDGITCGVHCDQCWRYCYQGWDADEL